jgi:cAMP phosphodiesterase
MQNGALVVGSEATEHLQECRFTASVWPDDSDELTFVDIQINPVQDLNITVTPLKACNF